MPKTYHCGQCGISCEGRDSYIRHLMSRHKRLIREMIKQNFDHFADQTQLEVFGDA